LENGKREEKKHPARHKYDVISVASEGSDDENDGHQCDQE
jgi:hypothetical protein